MMRYTIPGKTLSVSRKPNMKRSGPLAKVSFKEDLESTDV
jgi:hypothetical protein